MALHSPRARAQAPASSSSSAGGAGASLASPPRRCRVAVAAAAVATAAAAASPPASPLAAARSRGRSFALSPPGRLSLVACRATSFSSSSGEGADSSAAADRRSPTTTAPATPFVLGADDLPPFSSGNNNNDNANDAYASAEAAERLWRRLVGARRELSAAVEREDFPAAAALRDEVRALSAALPPVRQYVLHQLERLRTGEPPAPLFGSGGGFESIGGSDDGGSNNSNNEHGGSAETPLLPFGGSGGGKVVGSGSGVKKTKNSGTVRGIRAENSSAEDGSDDEAAAALRRAQKQHERLSALAALAEAGDAAVLPDLARALRDPELQPAAQDAMWAVFGRSPDPRVAEMMEEGGKLLGAGAGGPGGTNPSLEAALAAFDRVLALSPDFAEAHNKRATVLYLLGRHEQAVRACEACLAINPWHFGAASGQGLCEVARQRPLEALRAFERALEIHPGLTQIARYAAALRLTLEERERLGGGGAGGVMGFGADDADGVEGDGGAAAAGP